MPLARAACAAREPTLFALTALAASLSRLGVALLVVDAAAKVTRALSSMNWTWMFLLLKKTLIRGRSFVPLIFLRTRQWRRVARSCFFSVLMVEDRRLLDRLAFLAHDTLIAVAHALAFVRFRRIEAADFGRNLSYHLAVRPLDGEFGILLHGHFDLIGNIINDRMGVAQVEIDRFTGDSRLKANPLNLEFLNKAFAYAADHVVDEGTTKAVQRPGVRVVSLTAHEDLAIIDFQ